MPRPRKALSGPNAIIASAARIQGRRARGNVTTAGASGDWQDEAVYMVTAVGELGFYRDWKANAFSRVTVDLEMVTVEDGEEKTTKVTTANARTLGPLAEAALAAREALFDGDDGESELMRAFGQHLSVPGEAWLFGIAEPKLEDPDAPDRWRVLARTELKQNGSTWEVNRGDGNQERYSMGDATGEGAEAIAIRIWNPNPDLWAQADSSVRNALPILRQIKGLHELDGASIDSRLKGAGVVFVPAEMTFSAPLDPNGDPTDVRQDEFMADLTEVMMLARSDRSSAAAHVPIVVKVPGAMIEKIKHITFDTPFDERSDEKLDRAITRLATTLDCPAQILLGLADVNHWCVDEDTEVLTRRGWVGIDGFTVGDEVLALDHETGEATWAPTADVYRASVTDEPMLAMESRTHSSLTTLHHKWPTVTPDGVRRWRMSADLNAYDSIATAAPVRDLPATAKYDDALVELLGWLWTEGSISRDGRVSIAQSHTRNPDRVVRIRSALTTAFGVAGFTERTQPNVGSYGGPVTVFYPRVGPAGVLTDLAPRKQVRLDVVDAMTLAQLHLFIDTSCAGDGVHWRTGRRDIWQRDPAALDAYERACILAGYATSRTEGHSGGTVVTALASTSVRPVKAAEQAQRSTRGTATVETVPYTGRIWCPAVPRFRSFLARRRGLTFYTGNTGWLLDEQALKYHVQSPAGLVMDGLTKRYLWATLAGPTGVLPLEVRAFRFKANVSKLQQKPDRAVNAPAAHAELLITDKAYAATIGFDPADLLDTDSDEFRRRLLIAAAMRPGGPDTVTQALTALGVQGISPPAAMVAPGQEPPPAITGPDQGAAPDGGDGPPVQPPAPPAGPVAASGEEPDPYRAAALILGCEARVERAIEKARNRVHQRSRTARPIPADRMDWALEGAWEQVPRIAASLDVDETALLDALNRYTRGVLSTGTDHSPDVFTRVIMERVLRA